MHKKLFSMEREVEVHKEKTRKLQNDLAALNNVLSNQEKDIVVLKKETKERDDTIQNKVGSCSLV